MEHIHHFWKIDLGFIDDDENGFVEGTLIDKDEDGITFGDRIMIPRSCVMKMTKILKIMAWLLK